MELHSDNQRAAEAARDDSGWVCSQSYCPGVSRVGEDEYTSVQVYIRGLVWAAKDVRQVLAACFYSLMLHRICLCICISCEVMKYVTTMQPFAFIFISKLPQRP